MGKQVKKYFWLALLAHLFLFLSLSFNLVFEPDQLFEKKSDRYLPAYIYQQDSAAQKPLPSQIPIPRAQETPPQPLESNPDAIALKKIEVQQKAQAAQKHSRSAAAFIEAESLKTGKPHDEPLLKELSRATAAKLYYPPEAAAYHIKGTVTISFLLFPDGTVSEVAVAQSSGFRILDLAAFNTIKSISPVRDANLYLTKPRYILAGIIFG